MRQTRRRARWTLAVGLIGILVGAMVPSSGAAAGPTVVVDPAGPLGDGPTTITVRGSGFDPAANGGVGIYVVFGRRTAAPAYHDDALLYSAARWVHPGASDTPGQAALRDDGTFETTLDIAPRYTDGHDTPVDCLVVDCALITMSAHGVADRSFDTFTPISFGDPGRGGPAVAVAAGTSGTGSLWVVGAAVVVGLVVAALLALMARRRRIRRRGSEQPSR